ncbi:MAG: glycosyltransferase family 4 protein [Acidobacteriia bacterium]|nr:glycosyltransferase family 4 protein [Terriglobia bacterium]
MDDPKPTIAFDTEPLDALYRNQGIYVYTRTLLAQFRELASGYGVEVCPFVSRRAENDANGFAPAPGFAPVSARWLHSSRMWRYGGAWLSTRRMRPDVVFSPTFSTLQFRSGAARVVTIHDATPVIMPNFAPMKVMRKLQFALKHAARHSDRVITISQCSQNDLARVLGIPASKISVVYSGYDAERFNAESPDPAQMEGLRRKFGLERPYIFHHGFIQPRKNLKRLVQAFRRMTGRASGPEIDLVLAGGLGWRSEELVAEARAAASPRGRVVMTGPLSDSDLVAMIKGSTLVVIPSLYEGFCLPMLEAMACGVPVIAAASSCIPEISGNVLKYFDPESDEEIAERMTEALAEPGLRRELAERGLARAREFSWRRCAEQTLALLKEAARTG